MPNEQLVAHIRDEFARGVDKTALVQSLLANGWRVEDINVAMNSVAPLPTQNMPVTFNAPTVSIQQNQQNLSLKTVIQDMAAGLFVICVTVLTVVSIMGVWKIFSTDVIWKSFETLGLLALVAVIVIIASRFVGDPSVATEVAMPRPRYRAIRNITLATLIVSSSFLALFGVLSIWEIITDKDVVNKSLSSLGIIAFASLIIVMVCLEREQNEFWKKRSGEMSGGAVIAGIVLIWLLMSFLR